MRQKIVGLVQARMGSTRLPGKVMMELSGKPMIWHIFDRLQRVSGLDGIVLATTMDPRNNAMIRYAELLGIPVYCESDENDIVSRLVGAANLLKAELILKINGDCPVVDVDLIEKMVRRHRLTGDTDYLSNKVVWSYPKGLSAELISTAALSWCNENLIKAEDRELVCDWIRDHPEQFNVYSIEYHRDLSHYNWMVDTPEDFDFMSRLFDALYEPGRPFGLNEVLRWVEQDPAHA